MPALHNASSMRSMRSIVSRRKRDVASNYPLDASFLIMDDDDDGFSFATGIWPSSATARVKAFFTPRSRGDTSPSSSGNASSNTSPLIPSPLGQSPTQSKTNGFKASIAKACRVFQSNTGYSPMKEDKKVQRVVQFQEQSCPLADAKEERKWQKLAAERQKLVDQGKRQAEQRKAKEEKRRLKEANKKYSYVESGPNAGWMLDRTGEPHGPGDLPPIEAVLGFYHDGRAMRQCRLSQIGDHA